MNLAWLVPLSTTILFIGSFSKTVSKPDKVHIGSIFAFGTINGRVANISMNAAVEDINSDPTILNGTKLHLSMQDSNYSSFLSIVGGKISNIYSILIGYFLTYQTPKNVHFLGYNLRMNEFSVILVYLANSITIHGD